MSRTMLMLSSVFAASNLLLLDSAIKAAVILAMAGIAGLLLRRDSAATRHLVWLVAIVAVLIVPVFSVVLPQWRILPAWARISTSPNVASLVEADLVTEPEATGLVTNSATEVVAPPETYSPAESVQSTAPATSATLEPIAIAAAPPKDIPQTKSDTETFSISLGNVVTFTWLAGCGVLLLRLLAARLMLWSNENRATNISNWRKSKISNHSEDPAIVAVFESAARKLGIRQRVSLLLDESRTIPVVWGIFRHRLLLPATARQWSSEQLRSVLLHELAHIKRRDAVVQLIGQIACALHWFNPLVWFAAWRLHVERERACDDLVLGSGVRPSTYAEHLLDVATRLTTSPWTQACGLAMAHRSSLDDRLQAVLSEKRNRRSVTKLLAGVALMVGATVVIPVAMLRAADEGAGGEASPTSSSSKDTSKPSGGTKLPAKTEAILRWGKPVNGLRAALTRLPSLGEPKNGHHMDFDLVVQNVSKTPIRLTGNTAAPDHRTVAVRQKGSTLFRIVSKEPSDVDVLLQPREVIVLRVFPDNDAEKGKPLAENPRFSFYGMIEIKTAPAGAWTGKLITPDVSGAVVSGKLPANDENAAADEPKPNPGTNLEARVEQKLKWGTAVNGLRSAIMIRRDGNGPLDMFLVVQNVSEANIRINDSAGDNEHTLLIKLNGKLVQGLGGKEPNFGDVLLRPREAVVIPAFPLPADGSDGVYMGFVVTDNAIRDKTRSLYAKIDLSTAPDGAFRGKLQTGETTGVEAAVSPLGDLASAKSGTHIQAKDENRLAWGKPNNGLRAALAIRQESDDEASPENLFLVVQNVSKAPIHFHDKIPAKYNRTLVTQREQLLQAQTVIDQPTGSNIVLHPRQVALLLMVPPKPGSTRGQSAAANLQKESTYNLTGELKIEKAPPGAWTGELVTGLTRGTTAKDLTMPKTAKAKALFQKWQGRARLNGKIPGGQLRTLEKATSNFVKYNPEDKRTPALSKLLEKMDTSRDWTPAEVVKLLDDVTDIYESLPSWAMELDRFEISDVMQVGHSLPDDLKDAPWGDALPNGLRAAWLLDPQEDEYRLNTPLKSRLLYHNNGKENVVFRVITWNQSGAHKATDAAGNAIEIRATSWTTIGQIRAVRLAPGEFTEVIGAGIGVGPRLNQEDWRNTRVGAWILAKAGDTVTFTPDKMTAGGKDGRRTEIPDEFWWPMFIANRLKQDAPLPNDAAERKRILDRAVRDLFGESPTADEIKTFVEDKAPDAIKTLGSRLAKRKGTVSYTGKLTSGTTTFKVLPVDPEAKHKPRLAIGPGRYELGNQVRLVIVGRGNVMDAKLEFLADNAPEPYKIKLPNGYGKWAIAWKRDLTKIWIGERGILRSIDFADPKSVKESKFDPAENWPVPKYFREALLPKVEVKDPPPATAAPPAASGK